MLALVRPLTLVSVALLRRLEVARPPYNLFTSFGDSGRGLFGSAVLCYVTTHIIHALFLDTIFWTVLLYFLRRCIQLVRTPLKRSLRLVLLRLLVVVLELVGNARRFRTSMSN
jgi:hypothetical protein